MTNAVKASLPATEVRTITAHDLKQDYRISVALPASYASHPEQSYPTIYLVDANFYFGMVTELTRIMHLCGRFPETIVVGIGYPVDEPLADAFEQIFRLRARDLTPVVERTKEQEESNQTGGAREFLTFLQTELIPIIEGDYRANPAIRVLAGHSYGGLFVLYVLFHQPKLFKGYVAGSPSLGYGDKVTFTYETAFAARHKSLPVNLYLGVGGREELVDDTMVSDLYQFAARLESRKYKGLSLTKQIVENCDHCAFTAPTFQAGLQAVLS
jgi:predicted alpha/beta superfamily hydrolase